MTSLSLSLPPSMLFTVSIDNKITIIGHDEGTMITPRVAIDNATQVKNIVLMGAVSQNICDILYLQMVSTSLLYAEKVLGCNHDGLL
jgi:hypothetical protein